MQTNDEVSSSSPSSSASSSEPQACVPPGTPVSLQGKIWMEMDNALVLNVDWKGRNFAGTLLKADDTNVWAPPRLYDFPPNAITKSVWNKFNTFGEKSRRRGPRQRGMYSRKYPRSFVDSSNIVESKLRYGRDKWVPAYSSCPSSPRNSDSRTDMLNRRGLRSANGLKRSTSFSIGKAFGQSANPTQNNEGDDKGQTQCDEVGSTRLSDNPIEDFDCKTNLKSQTEDDGSMLSLSRMDIYTENGENVAGNSNSSTSCSCSADNSPGTTSLSQYKARTNKSYEAKSDEQSDQNSVPCCSICSKGDEIRAAKLKVAPWNTCETTDSLPVSNDDCEKTYTNLENCDLRYLQLAYPADNESSMSSA